MGGAHQVEDLDVIPVLAVQLRGIPIELALGVRHHHRLTPLDGLEQGIADHRPGLHGTGSTEDRDMPVQSGVFWHTDDLTAGLAQDRALRLLRCRHLQNLLHLLLGHPGSGSVKSIFGDGKAALVMDLAVKLIMQLDVDEDPAEGGQQQPHTDQSSCGKGVGKAGTEIPRHSGHLRLAGHTAGIHPFLVVLQHLPDNSAEVEQREQTQYGDQCNQQCFSKLMIQIQSLLSSPGRFQRPQAR